MDFVNEKDDDQGAAKWFSKVHVNTLFRLFDWDRANRADFTFSGDGQK